MPLWQRRETCDWNSGGIMGNSERSKREIWVGSSLPAKSTITQTPLGKDFGSNCYLFIQMLDIQLILGYLQRNSLVCIEPPCHKGDWLCSQDNREVLVQCKRLYQPRKTMPVPGLFLSKCMGNPFPSNARQLEWGHRFPQRALEFPLASPNGWGTLAEPKQHSVSNKARKRS